MKDDFEGEGDKAAPSQGYYSLPITQPLREFCSSSFLSIFETMILSLLLSMVVGVGSFMGIYMGLSKLLVTGFWGFGVN